MVLLICSVSVVLYSAGSGVKSMAVVLDALRVVGFVWSNHIFLVGMAVLVVVLCMGLRVLIGWSYRLRMLQR